MSSRGGHLTQACCVFSGSISKINEIKCWFLGSYNSVFLFLIMMFRYNFEYDLRTKNDCDYEHKKLPKSGFFVINKQPCRSV